MFKCGSVALLLLVIDISATSAQQVPIFHFPTSPFAYDIGKLLNLKRPAPHLESQKPLPGGELSFSLPILTLAGKNGLNFELSLTYNSAVKAVVEDKFMTSTGSETLPDNAKMQVSEVGLGWSLNLPKIVRGTYFYPPISQNLNFITSDAYLVSNGSSNKLIDLGYNDYGLNKHDYSKIHYNGGTDEWTITDRIGVTYTFAHVQTTYDWTHSVIYPNFNYAKHSMTWFLTKIQDVFGNQIGFEYESDDITLSMQYYECIVSGQCDWKSWSSPDTYVKATRVTKITDSRGRVIKFNYASDRQDTPSINQQDPPYKFAIHYSNKRLDYIEVWDKDPGNPVAIKTHYIDFEHDYLTIGVKKKMLLEFIQFRDPTDPMNDSKAQPATKFTYKNTSSVKGPLETVTAPNGGVTTYDFDTKSHQSSVIDYKMISKTVDDGISVSPGSITYSYGTVAEVTEDGFKYYVFPDITETGPVATAKTVHHYEVTAQNLIGTENKTEYNSIGKVEKQYQPKRISNATHTFYTGTTPFTEYEQFEYQGDPLARVEKQTHTSAANGEISFAYGAEQINGAGFVYAYQQVTGELGKIAKSYADRFGNPVGAIGADGTGGEITARCEFDILGNTTTVKPPNEQAGITGNWNSTSKYSTLGQVVEETNPDEDLMYSNGPTCRYVYDNLGNLRFSQDAGQYGTSQYDFTVYYYDAFGRVTQVGVEKDDFNWTDISGAPATSNTTYGTEAGEWRIKYYYDVSFVSGVANYCTGRLAKVEVNDDSDSAVEHITKYVYDKFGNIIEKHITIDGGSPLSEQTIRHIYDHLGREIQTIYPSGNTVSRKYDALGRLEKIFSIQ